MKRLSLTFMAFTLAIVFATGQANNPYGTGNSNASRVFETCPANSLFGQEPSTPTGGWTSPISDISSPYNGTYGAYYDDFSGVTGSICSLSFWGFPWQYNSIWYPCTENPMTFRIRFYEYNTGSLGNLVLDFNAEILGAGTGITYVEAGGEIGELNYYYVQLPQVLNLSSGWVSVQGISIQNPVDCGFGWMNSPTGNSSAIIESPAGSYGSTGYSLSFCLGTECQSAPVPVSTWALVLGGALIALGVFLRYRRIV